MKGRSRPDVAGQSRSDLMAPAAWVLQPGVAQAPFVRLGVTLFLCAMAVLSVVWLTGVAQDTLRGGRSAWLLSVTLLAWLLWMRLWWRTSCAWHAKQPVLHVRWLGAAHKGLEAHGWYVRAAENWRPAELDLILDAQAVLLCRVRMSSLKGGGRHDVHWCWLNAASIPDVHRLRSLLRSSAFSSQGASANRLPFDASDFATPRVASCRLSHATAGAHLADQASLFLPTQPMGWAGHASLSERGVHERN